MYYILVLVHLIAAVLGTLTGAVSLALIKTKFTAYQLECDLSM